jgi:7-keto-8-aminopelargonate synthetase-like enzyme
VKIEQRILAELADLESWAQLRHLEAVRGIDLGSNDYLGLSTDSRMKQAIREAVDSAPRVASTGSRLLSGHDDAWTAVENDFARWVGVEAALYFTSGYAANMGLLSAVLRPEDVVFSDSSNHASLIVQARYFSSPRSQRSRSRASLDSFRFWSAIHRGGKHLQHGRRTCVAAGSCIARSALWR